MTVAPSALKPSSAGKIFVASCVLVFVATIAFMTGLRKGCETGFAAASQVLYAETGGDLVKSEAYVKAVDWLATRTKSLGTAEAISVKQTYSGIVGLPCTVELNIKRGGREYIEVVQFNGSGLEAMNVGGR